MIFSIIIPAYNEEQSIASIIERSLAARAHIQKNTAVREVEIIVVSDGSKDKTVSIASQYKEISLISYTNNRGYGAAIKQGFHEAKGQLVGFLDADGTCDPLFFSDLINLLKEEKADIAIGSRMGPASKMPFIRRVGNTIYAWIINFLARVQITDCASGMRVIRRDSLQKIYPLPDGLNFTPAMTCRAILHQDLKIVEKPMSYKEREGRSKLNVVKDGVRFLKTIFEMMLFYKPFKILGMIGLVLIAIGLLYSIYPIYFYLIHRRIEEYFIYRLITIVVALLIGMGFILYGLLADQFVCLMNQTNSTSNRLLTLLKSRSIFLSGLILAFSGILLNSKTITQYVTTGHITIHWIYILTGAFLLLTGMQILTFSFLQKLLEMYKSEKSFTQKTLDDR